MATKYTYDKKKDYQAMINQAVDSGDFRSAALYEQQRNQKIDDMNAAKTNAKGHQKTDLYSQYLNGGTNTAQGYLSELASSRKPADSENYNKWQQALEQYQNAKFEYDFDSDPQKQSYERNAQKNYEDTLAQTSARTGGLASSYAGQASQQAYQDTMTQAYQILYNLARDDFNNEQTRTLNTANQYWNAYQNDLDLSNTDWERMYSLYGLVNDQETAKTAADKEAAEAEKESALMAAYGGDYSRFAKAYGITDAQARAYLAAANGAGSSRSSGSGRSSGGSSGSAKAKSTDGIVDTMLSFGDDTKAYEYLVGLKYTNSITENLWNLYQSARGSGNSALSKLKKASASDTASKIGAAARAATSKTAGTVSSYDKAKANMMTASEFEQEKHLGNSSAKYYDTYADYVKAYNEWLETLR